MTRFPGTQLVIAAPSDNTTVTITPSVTTGARTAGVPYVITLNQGQTYALQNTGSEPSDLSGTLITSDKPIAVFGSHSAANIPAPAVGFADYLVEQLISTDTWGTEFVTVPLATRPRGDTFRILAAANGTNVSVDGANVATLDRGQLHEFTLTAAAHITSDQPILVAQYANSALFDDSASDPFMMLVPAISQYLGQYTITTEVDDLPSNFVNLTVPDSCSGLDRARRPVA